MKSMVALFVLSLALSVTVFLVFHLRHRNQVPSRSKAGKTSTYVGGITFPVNDVVQPEHLRASVDAETFLSEAAATIKETPDDRECVYEIFKERSANSGEVDLYGPERTEWLTKCQGPAGLVDPDAHSVHPYGLLSGVHENGFIAAVSTSFAEHYPLSLRPEHIWALILQGVAAHVNENAEELRKNFVSHEGKMELLVRRDSFRLHERGNDWAGVVAEFVDQINENTREDTVDMMTMDFSTTTKDERVCGMATIMNVVQQYFDFKLQTICGYPRITLEGSLDDWIKLRKMAEALVTEKCTGAFAEFWLPALLPVLDKFVAQYQNPSTVDVAFWQSMSKRGGMVGSGGFDWLNGWFNVFFPILKNKNQNPFCVPYSTDAGYVLEGIDECEHYYTWGDVPDKADGPDVELIPSGIVSANVTWEYFDIEVPLQFRSGFVGAEQREDGTIAPALGWYIRYGRI